MTMVQACEDVLAEAAALRALVERPGTDPDAVTPFHGWRIRDSVGHMVTIDGLARLALDDPAAFAVDRAAFIDGTRIPAGTAEVAGGSFRRIAAYENGLLGGLAWTDLLDRWADGLEALRAAAVRRDGGEKVEWFGAPIRVASLLAARQMEIWAYGQDVFDLAGVRRAEGDRLRNVVEFAMRTFGFSFANRGLAIPPARPFVALTAPSGQTWTWNDPEADDRIEGAAADFCLVATQRRHVDDTALALRGDVARRWMLIAQCIAGAPIEGPAPGERGRAPT